MNFYLKQQLTPTFFWGIFLNPFYIVKRNLNKKIKKYSDFIGGTTLDFGCGSKPYKKFFRKHKEYIGIDVEKSGNNQKCHDVDCFYDGEKIPYEDNYFDSIFSSEVFEHIFNLEAVVKELYRVCKKGGKLLITTPFVWDEHEIPFDYGRYTSFGIKYLLEKNNFKVLFLEKSSNYIETIFQAINCYLYRLADSEYKILKIIFGLLLYPFFVTNTILGLILSRVLPKRYDMYNNLIILAEKI